MSEGRFFSSGMGTSTLKPSGRLSPSSDGANISHIATPKTRNNSG